MFSLIIQCSSLSCFKIIASFILIRAQRWKFIHKSRPLARYCYSNATELFTPLKKSTTLTNMSWKASSLKRRDNGNNNDDDDDVEGSAVTFFFLLFFSILRFSAKFATQTNFYNFLKRRRLRRHGYCNEIQILIRFRLLYFMRCLIVTKSHSIYAWKH